MRAYILHMKNAIYISKVVQNRQTKSTLDSQNVVGLKGNKYLEKFLLFHYYWKKYFECFNNYFKNELGC